MAEQKLLLGNVRGPQGAAGPNTVSSSTTTSGFEDGHVLYNNNGKVGAKKLSASDVGALSSGGTAQKANFLVGGGVGTQYNFGAYEMQCFNMEEVPNTYSLKSIYRSDGNYHLHIYNMVDASMQKTYSDFAGAVSGSSSIRFKDDVQPVNGDVLDALLTLDVIDFVYNDKAPDYSQDGLRHFGLIAEQVAKAIPNSVKMDTEGLPAAVVYSDLIPLMLAILQRQQKKLSALEQRIQKLEEGNKE